MLARSIGKARKDTGEPLTVDGFSQSAKEVLGAGAASVAGTLVIGTGMSLAGKGLGALFGQRGLVTGALGRQHRLFQIQKDRLVSGFRQQTQQATLQRDAALKTAREQSAAALQGVATGTKQQLAALTAEQEAVHRSMQEVAEQSVLKVREAFPGVAKRTSEQYRALVDDAVKGLEDVEVPFAQLITALHKRFAADPEMFGLALKRLGLSEDLAMVLTKTGPSGIEGLSRGQVVTVKNILQRIGKMRQGIKTPAKASKRVYTFEEKIIDDTSDALLEVLEQNGIQGLEKASAFWAQWAPIRNQAFRDFRPFLQTETETATGIGRLIRVARGRDPGNAKFITELETRLEVPLTNELRGMAQRLTGIQKERLAANLNRELQTTQVKQVSQQAVDDAKELFTKTAGGIESQEQAAVSQLGRQQFTQQQALQRKVGTTRLGVNVAKWILIYQILRRGINAVIPKSNAFED